MKLHNYYFPFLLWGLRLFILTIAYYIQIVSKSVLIEWNLFKISSIIFRFNLIIDKVSVSFNFVVLIISARVFTFACKYIVEDIFFKRFIWILVRFVISIILLIYSGSLFFLLLGWDGLGVTSFALIIYYSRKESLAAGFLTLRVNRIGDVVIISTIVLFIIVGHFTISVVYISIRFLALIITFASLTKRAQYPFSSWLPAAIAAPTPVSALVHSSTLVTAGVYLVIRLTINIPINDNICSLLCLCGRVTSLLGGFAAIFENDLKKIIALSTLRQLGVIMFRLGLNSSRLALFHLFTHAIFKALLFLAAGVILIIRFGTQDIRLLGGILQVNPLISRLFIIRRLCLIGAPFISSFFSKHVILEIIFSSNINIFSLLVIFISSIFTSVYVVRSLKIFRWNKRTFPLFFLSLTWKDYIPIILLRSLGIIIGQIYKVLNDTNFIQIFIPLWLQVSLNISGILGLIVGLFILFKKNIFASSLFFTTSLRSSLNKSTYLLSLKIRVLDYGWLEPIYFFNFLIKNVIVNIYNFLVWPSISKLAFRLFVFYIIIWLLIV